MELIWLSVPIFLFVLAYLAKKRSVKLLVKPNSEMDSILKHCKSLKSFNAAPWITFNSGLYHTFLANVIRKTPNIFYKLGRKEGKYVQYDREMVQMEDGGEVALDWKMSAKGDSNTIVILLHSLSGGGRELYMQWVVDYLTKQGLNCVVFTNRGCGGSKLKTPRPFNGRYTGDLRTVVKHVQEKYEGKTLVGVGYSLGASILANYVSEEGENCALTGAMCVSAPVNYNKLSANLARTKSNRKLDRMMTKNLQRWFVRNQEQASKNECINIEKVLAARTCAEFDRYSTGPVFGYKDEVEYYADASCMQRIHNSRIPVFFLSAEDDPIAPIHEEAPDLVSDNVAFAVSKVGGHIGWCTGLYPNGIYWSDLVVHEFINALCLKRKEE
eukprot:TRINITY_DN775953_c0_g1_i1.p1 TRINITY_DN775953_c0_g1~~TRINITY_DN775953_c0_g1_i1.p1  ORF type:complete len:384 (-),score=90.14 TRINITY_DN775953_c0_g1_i1:220-1371(-)